MVAMVPRVKFQRLRPDAVVPKYMTAEAAGMDLSAAVDAPIAIAPGARAVIGTGLAMELPLGFEGQLRPRSGLAREHGITLANAPATIDSDYRGHVAIVLVNHGDRPVTIEPGMRIAQLVIAPVVQAEVEVVDALSTSARGAGGFGSTGR